MSSPLAQVSKLIAQGFNGKLYKGTLRRETSSTVNSFGDRVAGTPQTFAFQGIRDSFNAVFAQAAGIPITDARILIIAGLCKTVPVKDDKVLLNGEWFQLRQLVERDPAGATYVFAGFSIAAP